MLNCRIIGLIFILTSVRDISEGIPLTSETTEHVTEIQSPDVCYSDSCFKAAEIISNNMDFSVNPCDDFYKFACGSFIYNNTIPPFTAKYNSFSNINDIISNQLKTLIEEKIEENEIKPFKMVKQFYKDCLKADIITGNALKVIQDKIDDLGGWPQLNESLNNDNDSWIYVLEQSRKLGLRSNYILSIYIDINYKNATTKNIHIEKPYIRTKIFSLLTMRPDYNSNSYFKMMVNIAMKNKIPFDKAVQELTPVLLFETELAKIYETMHSKTDRINNSLITTIEDIHNRMPTINWLNVINALLGPKLNVTKNEAVIMISPNFMRKLEKLLERTPRKTLVNFILWRNIQESLHFYFIDNVQPKWKTCLSLIQQNLDIAFSAMYVRRHFSNGMVKKNVLEIVKTIREEQYNILSASDWIDKETRQAALEKAQSTTERVAYPEELWNDTALIELHKDLNLEPNKYYDNLLKISDYRMNIIFSKIREPVNKTNWFAYRYLFIANAFNVFEENSIEIPSVLLQGKFYSVEWPNYLNYGAIGFVISHELSHAFDSNGHYYDKEGNYENWWQLETEKKYKERIKCFIEQYDKFVVDDTGESVNGTNTLAENISDNEGIRTAYRAYKAWVREHGTEKLLPGLSYSPEQLFWISAANSWCAKYTFLYMIETFSKDVHSPDKIRILGTFSNQKEFAEDFKCPVDSIMNPTKKCSLW